jgi:putative hemolysin
MKIIVKNYKTVILLIGIGGIASACTPQKKMALANPASQYCIEQGGTIHIEKGPDGGARGICLFGDNRQCEEWALFRGDCPIGGVKITGYTTPASTYCAIRGGKVLENETKCQLPSGKICSVQDVYEGKCS